MSKSFNKKKLGAFSAGYYEEHMKPKEAEFERHRINALAKYKRRFVVSVLVCIATTIYGILGGLFHSGPGGELSFLIIILYIGAYYWTVNPISDYENNMKSALFPEIFKLFGNLTYSKAVNVNLDELQTKSEIIPNYGFEFFEDYIGGKVAGVDLEMFYAKLTCDQKVSLNNIKFEGLMIIISMNKNFSGRTIIKKDAGRVGNLLERRISKYENVKLESSAFEKIFEVYSSDQVEARYLLTTAFMEKLIEVSEVFDAKMQCSFFDDKLLILLETHNRLFDTPSVRKPVHFNRNINKIMKEIELIESLVRILELNSKTHL